MSRSVTLYSKSHVCQKGLQEAQNVALSQDNQPFWCGPNDAYLAVRALCIVHAQPSCFGLVWIWRVNEVCVYMYINYIIIIFTFCVCFARFTFIVVISVGIYLDRNLLFLIIGGPARFYLFKKKLGIKMKYLKTKNKLPPRWLHLIKYYIIF